MLPSAASVGRAVHAVAVRRHDAADGVLTHSHVDHVRVGRSDRDRADRCRTERRVGDALPRRARVGGLPDSASDAAEVVGKGIRRHAGHRNRSATPEGADVAPLHALEQLAIDFLGACRRER